jgi:hypothetical protein
MADSVSTLHEIRCSIGCSHFQTCLVFARSFLNKQASPNVRLYLMHSCTLTSDLSTSIEFYGDSSGINQRFSVQSEQERKMFISAGPDPRGLKLEGLIISYVHHPPAIILI